MQRGSFQWMKSLNKSIILNKIRINGPISRAQISKDTQLTPPTVGTIVKELIEQGLVKESTQGISQGGRKPTMLVINSTEFYIIGIDAGPKDIKFVLSDLSGKLVDRQIIAIQAGLSNEKFLTILKEGIYEMMDENHQHKEKIIGVGVAMHGVVDIETGTSLFAPNLHLRDIPIKQALEAEFEFVVKVENDARSMALGEAWFGDSVALDSMMTVNIGRGVGAGLIVNGKLYHGAYDIAGEIGHMTIDIHGQLCECGNHGCLQTFASGPALAERALQALEQNEQSSLTQWTKDGSELTGEVIYQEAINGDEFAKKILEETGMYIGVGLTNLIHIINPSKVIIGGGVSNAGEFILNSIQSTIEKRALTAQAKKTEVVISSLRENATVLGAVALLLVELFDLNGSVSN
ncbi:ROK family transcriptional regulator [Radiobacillus sp. PE A8.2]|uniref:ROK family transcriptional regulator n=1 Tax=Radiobacillus sp. PE A8.2 TaxID=3380349 RepID=UPI003890808A